MSGKGRLQGSEITGFSEAIAEFLTAMTLSYVMGIQVSGMT